MTATSSTVVSGSSSQDTGTDSLDTSSSSLHSAELCDPGQAPTVSQAPPSIRLFDPRAPGAKAGAIHVPGGQGLTLVGPFRKSSTLLPPAVILTTPQSLRREGDQPVTAAVITSAPAITEPPITPQVTVTRTARRPGSSLSPPPVPKKKGRPLLGDTVKVGKVRMADLRGRKMVEEEKSKVVLRVVEEAVREMLEEVATAKMVEVESKKMEKQNREKEDREKEDMEREASDLIATTDIEDMEEEKESSSFTPETPWGKMSRTT